MNDKMVAHYEVSSKLGEGGMGEVYRARDTKLDREVALKFLPPEVATDPERLARFRREAKVLASLNHPNIAGVHGLEEAEGKLFLVMELAEGEDLSKRLSRGTLAVPEAVEIAAQIAEGLEEAHEKGIVHRDLKPANVMVGSDGRVKILDFGLARAYAGDSVDEGDLANSPTITAAMTQMGTILGTAAYMSPEQAKGRPVDRRADIWSFGVILYEMLTGDTPFLAETISETVAAVLMRPIDLSGLPAEVPPSLATLLQRCLERDPRKRLRDIGEARVYLQDPAAASLLSSSIPPGMASAVPAGAGAASRPWLPWAVAGLLAVALAVVLIRGGASGPGAQAEAPLIWSSLESPSDAGFHLSGTNPAPATFSPDGTRIVYGARTASASPDLWLQELSAAEPHKLPGTSGGSYQFWSPDGQSVAFYSGSALNVMDLATETRRQVAAVSGGKGGCWTVNDQILFTASSSSPISKLDLTTGDITEITDLRAEPLSNSHRHPRMLTEDSFLFTARLDQTTSGSPVAIMVGHLDGTPPTELLRSESQAEFVDGYLLYLNEANLIARPLDVETLKFTGPPLTLATDVGRIPGAALALFSSATVDNLVFHPGYSATLSAKLAWFDESGDRVGEAAELEAIGNFDVSPDGRRVAIEIWGDRTGLSDLWLYDLQANLAARLTFEGGSERTPQWSPDGSTIYYIGDADGETRVMALEPESRSEPRELFNTTGLVGLSDVSPDGKWLSVVAADTASGSTQAYVVPVDGSAGMTRVDDSGEDSYAGHFSPDGRWIAYALADEGSFKIYLKTNPPTSRKWQMTDQPAFWFDWSPEGDRMYFQGGSSELFATDIDLSGTTPRTGQTRVAIDTFPNPVTNLHSFSVGGDGKTFFVTDAGANDDARPLRLVLNWSRLLERAAVPR